MTTTGASKPGLSTSHSQPQSPGRLTIKRQEIHIHISNECLHDADVVLGLRYICVIMKGRLRNFTSILDIAIKNTFAEPTLTVARLDQSICP